MDLKDLLYKHKTSLESLDPYPWANVEQWKAAFLPVLVESLPKHLDGFEKVVKEPRWCQVPLMSYEDECGHRVDNVAEARMITEKEDRELASNVKNRVLAFIDTLISLVKSSLSQDKRVRKVSQDTEFFLRLVFAHQRDLETTGAAEELLDTKEIADALGWSPNQINRVLTLLNNRGLLEMDESGGSAPYDTHGFRLSHEGVLECERLGLDQSQKEQDNDTMSTTISADPKKVFIIHGRNLAARTQMEHFLRALDLEPIDFDQLASGQGGMAFIGDIVRAGLKQAQGIVVLFTPDEYAALRTGHRETHDKGDDILRWQARPNVIFEAGIAYGIAQERTVLVTLGADVSLFSDVNGIHIVRLGNDSGSRSSFLQKLIGIGCAVNTRSTTWTSPERSGDFVSCIDKDGPKFQKEVSPRDPFRVG